MTTPAKPESLRLDAILKVLLSYRNAAWTGGGSDLMRSQAAIVTSIKVLQPMGGTQRWQDAIDNWADSVDVSVTEADIRWSMFQGAIFAAWAAA